jgi:hypothetical protein
LITTELVDQFVDGLDGSWLARALLVSDCVKPEACECLNYLVVCATQQLQFEWIDADPVLTDGNNVLGALTDEQDHGGLHLEGRATWIQVIELYVFEV